MQLSDFTYIRFLRHSFCDGSCTFHHYWAHAHFFTMWGIRMLIGKPRANTWAEKNYGK